MGVLAGLVAVTSFAERFPVRPGQHDFVADDAHVISAGDVAAIRATAEDLLSSKGIPIVVATIPSLQEYGGSDIRSYAESLFDTWGIGTQKNNRGILLVVSPGDRKARIELGADWGKSQNAECSRIMENVLVPAFRTGDYSSGIRSGVVELAGVARRGYRENLLYLWLEIALVGLAVAVAVSLIRNGKAGWGWALLAGVVLWLFLPRGDGGGGSFGGGSSGGGGATGSW